MIDVAAILERRYPDFFRRHRRVAVTLSRFLAYLFYQSRFEQFERDYPHLEGFDFVDGVLQYFDFQLRLRERELTRIPATGRVVIVANHPIGSLDGLALLNLVRGVRPDVRVVANDLLAHIKPLQSVLLPVNNMGGRTPRENLQNLHRHLEDEGALIIFPAGEVSRLGSKGVKDGPWHKGFVKMARKARAPILPIYVAGRNSLFFYSLSFLAKPISTMWLVREMFKQSHNVVDARVGNAVPYDSYVHFNASPDRLAHLFRKHVYRLPRGRRARPVFQTEETVAHPENRLLLRRELDSSEQLGETPDGKRILLYRSEPGDVVMRELGRLRELTFRSVGEGCGRPRDIDRYDRDYWQLILWDPEELEIAGAYRLGDAARITAARGLDGLYTHSLYRYGAGMQPYLQQGLELGRSFVQPRYQDRRSLDFLWWGIGAFLRRYPGYRYLFGPVTISAYYGREGTAHLVTYYTQHYGSGDLNIESRETFSLSSEQQAQISEAYAGLDRKEGFRVLKATLKARGLAVPPLYKHYMDAAEPEGVRVAAFNVDREFADCVDGFVMVDLEHLKPRMRRRYLDADQA